MTVESTSFGGENVEVPKEEGPVPVTLRVRDQTGDVMFFKVKSTTRMQKVLEAYSQRRGVNVESLRFMVDGDRVRPEDTPQSLDLADNEQIDVMLDVVGGGDTEVKVDGPIQLRVVDQGGEEMVFKMKKDGMLRKIFQAYADRKGVSVDVLRFSFDGTRVNAEDTPKMLELEENDQIDVLLHQVGGADEEVPAPTASSAPGEGEEAAGETPITVCVRDGTGDEMLFKVKKNTRMQKIFDAFIKRKGLSNGTMRFLIDGVRVTAEDTPKLLELEDGDQIDAVLEMEGGMDDDTKPDFENDRSAANSFTPATAAGGATNPDAGAKYNAPLNLKVINQLGDSVAFKVKPDTKFSKIFEAYAMKKGVDIDSIKFKFDGESLKADDTPKMWEMEDNSEIQAFISMIGGRCSSF